MYWHSFSFSIAVIYRAYCTAPEVSIESESSTFDRDSGSGGTLIGQLTSSSDNSEDLAAAASRSWHSQPSTKFIVLNYSIPDVPSVSRFFVALFADPFCASLCGLYEINVHAHPRASILTPVGSVTVARLPYPTMELDVNSKRIRTYASSYEDIALETGTFGQFPPALVVNSPEAKLTLRYRTLAEGLRYQVKGIEDRRLLPIPSVHTCSVSSRTACHLLTDVCQLLHMVDEDANTLVQSWMLAIDASPPNIDKY